MNHKLTFFNHSVSSSVSSSEEEGGPAVSESSSLEHDKEIAIEELSPAQESL